MCYLQVWLLKLHWMCDTASTLIDNVYSNAIDKERDVFFLYRKILLQKIIEKQNIKYKIIYRNYSNPPPPLT